MGQVVAFYNAASRHYKYQQLSDKAVHLGYIGVGNLRPGTGVSNIRRGEFFMYFERDNNQKYTRIATAQCDSYEPRAALWVISTTLPELF